MTKKRSKINTSLFTSKYLMVPYPICKSYAEGKLGNEIILYLYLKGRYGACADLNKINCKEIQSHLNITKRTFNSHLSLLGKRNWVGKNDKMIFIRAFARTMDLQGWNRISKVEFNLRDIQFFKSFSYAALITYLIKGIIRRERSRAGNKGLAHPRHLPPSFVPLSLSYITANHNLSEATTHRQIKQAIELKYLKIKKKYRFEEFYYKRDLRYLNQSTDKKQFWITKNEKIYKVESHLIATNLHFKSRKKMKGTKRDI